MYQPFSQEFLEETICTCGAGHGSGEGHTDWCHWLKVETFAKAAKIAGEMLQIPSLGAVRLNGHMAKRAEIGALLNPPVSQQ